MIYYHNPNCTKSRKGLELLKERGISPEVILYLENPLDRSGLQGVCQKLGMSPVELIRKNDFSKFDLSTSGLTDDVALDYMVFYPALMERPILVNGDKAVVARPAELVLDYV